MPFHKLTKYRLTYPAPKKLTFPLSLLLTVPLPFITLLPSERQPPSLLCVVNAWLVSRKAAWDIQLATTGILLSWLWPTCRHPSSCQPMHPKKTWPQPTLCSLCPLKMFGVKKLPQLLQKVQTNSNKAPKKHSRPLLPGPQARPQHLAVSGVQDNWKSMCMLPCACLPVATTREEPNWRDCHQPLGTV